MFRKTEQSPTKPMQGITWKLGFHQELINLSVFHRGLEVGMEPAGTEPADRRERWENEEPPACVTAKGRHNGFSKIHGGSCHERLWRGKFQEANAGSVKWEGKRRISPENASKLVVK